jgi:hypothetical protein
MAEPKHGAYLAHISDTVDIIAGQLGEHREVQQNILSVLGHLLETNQAQSEMLGDILGAASQEVGPSPVAAALTDLATQVQQMGESHATLIGLVSDLPEAIGRQFEISLRGLAAAKETTA